jgi:hypothetical protein
MRLITRKKVYRAFPELDRFDDERCERLIRRLRADVVGIRVILAPMGAFIAAFVLMALSAPLGWSACLRAAAAVLGRRDGELVLIAFVIAALVLAPSLAALLARDLVLGGAVRRALIERLELTRCRGCRYLLMGQRVIDGVIICPECGRPTTLAELGLHSPEDLIPPEEGQVGLPDELSRPEPKPEPPRVADTQRLLGVRERTRAEWDAEPDQLPRS